MGLFYALRKGDGKQKDHAFQILKVDDDLVELAKLPKKSVPHGKLYKWKRARWKIARMFSDSENSPRQVMFSDIRNSLRPASEHELELFAQRTGRDFRAKPQIMRSFAHSTSNLSHCDKENCSYCEIGQYDRCPNNR